MDGLKRPRKARRRKAGYKRLTVALAAAGFERLMATLLSHPKSGDPQDRIELRKAIEDEARKFGISPTALWRKVETAAKAKEHVRRANEYFRLLTDIAEKQRVVSGASLDADARELGVLSRHAESLWDDAVLLFRHRRHPRATGVAISCIEELGKVAVARLQVFSHQFDRQRGQPVPSKEPVTRKSPLYSHPMKHMLAAGAAALVNSRVDRVLGLNRVADFLTNVEQKKIEPFRQSCYYADRDASGITLPSRVTRKDATFYVVLAGELLADMAATPQEFERLLRRAKSFEKSIGHRWR
jgi:AbiV family abortive infection protein